MTEVNVNLVLSDNMDSSNLLAILRGIKGVFSASVTSIDSPSAKETHKKVDPWIKEMESLAASVDPSIVDMTDERTKQIMSK